MNIFFLKIIQNEYYHVQVQNDKRILEIENELNEKKSRLESYEKVENEMDLIIRQVAESSTFKLENKFIDMIEYFLKLIILIKRRNGKYKRD